MSRTSTVRIMCSRWAWGSLELRRGIREVRQGLEAIAVRVGVAVVADAGQGRAAAETRVADVRRKRSLQLAYEKGHASAWLFLFWRVKGAAIGWGRICGVLPAGRVDVAAGRIFCSELA